MNKLMAPWFGLLSAAMLTLAAVGRLVGGVRVEETLLVAIVFALWQIAAKVKTSE